MTKKIVTVRHLSSNKEVQNIATLSGSIAHELKNYLMAINICAELSEGKLKNIRERVKAANYLITNLQLQIKGIIAGEPETRDFRRYSIIKNIEEALKQYPCETSERKLITVKAIRDFKYSGNPTLTNHILYNLIKNSLRAIKNAGKGKIIITLEPDIKFNKLIFKDTATGISKKFLPKMFQLFASQMVSQGGTGIGLAFCKMIMESYGGDITCDSIEGKYTVFTLKFPRVE
jgi:two-component system, CAI-1 autoinducer sensor kinase/phosphatase CqsS